MQTETKDRSELDDQIAQSEAAIEAMESSTKVRELTFQWVTPAGNREPVTFIQEEMGFLAIQEFTTMMTKIINRFIKGEFGVKLGELFSGNTDVRQVIEMPAAFSPDAVNKVVEDNAPIIEAFLAVIEEVPEVELDIFCISLGITRMRRPWAKEMFAEPISRGGLSVDEGFDLLKWFISQNAPVIRRFFGEKREELVAEFQTHVLQQDPNSNNNSDSTVTDSEMPFDSPTESSPSTRGGTLSSISSPGTQEND